MPINVATTSVLPTAGALPRAGCTPIFLVVSLVKNSMVESSLKAGRLPACQAYHQAKRSARKNRPAMHGVHGKATTRFRKGSCAERSGTRMQDAGTTCQRVARFQTS